MLIKGAISHLSKQIFQTEWSGKALRLVLFRHLISRLLRFQCIFTYNIFIKQEDSNQSFLNIKVMDYTNNTSQQSFFF